MGVVERFIILIVLTVSFSLQHTSLCAKTETACVLSVLEGLLENPTGN